MTSQGFEGKKSAKMAFNSFSLDIKEIEERNKERKK